MDRRFSIQPIIRREGKEDEKPAAVDTGRRGSLFQTYGRTTRSWVKRANLAPDHALQFPEARSSWDESMRRRDSQKGVGLKGITLRKGFSDDAKNYLYHSECRRAWRTAEPTQFPSGKRLCKWETVNLLGIKEQAGDESLEASGVAKELKSAPGQKDGRFLCRVISRGESGMDISGASSSGASQTSSGHGSPSSSSSSSSLAAGYSSGGGSRLSYVGAMSRADSTGNGAVGKFIPGKSGIPTRAVHALSRAGSVERGRDTVRKMSAPVRGNRRDSSDSRILPRRSEGAVRDKLPVGFALGPFGPNKEKTSTGGGADEGYALGGTASKDVSEAIVGPIVCPGDGERRPSIIPQLNITKEQSNFEKFLDIISSQKGNAGLSLSPASGATEGEDGDLSIARTKSCEIYPQNNDGADKEMSIWERRKKAARSFRPGTRPIMLNIDAIDDLSFHSRSVSNTLVEISSLSETFFTKDDMHLNTRRSNNLTVHPNAQANAGGGGAGAGEKSDRKLKKPTNLWGLTRKISVKRKKPVEKEEKKENEGEEPR